MVGAQARCSLHACIPPLLEAPPPMLPFCVLQCTSPAARRRMTPLCGRASPSRASRRTRRRLARSWGEATGGCGSSRGVGMATGRARGASGRSGRGQLGNLAEVGHLLTVGMTITCVSLPLCLHACAPTHPHAGASHPTSWSQASGAPLTWSTWRTAWRRGSPTMQVGCWCCCCARGVRRRRHDCCCNCTSRWPCTHSCRCECLPAGPAAAHFLPSPSCHALPPARPPPQATIASKRSCWSPTARGRSARRSWRRCAPSWRASQIGWPTTQVGAAARCATQAESALPFSHTCGCLHLHGIRSPWFPCRLGRQALCLPFTVR